MAWRPFAIAAQDGSVPGMVPTRRLRKSGRRAADGRRARRGFGHRARAGRESGGCPGHSRRDLQTEAVEGAQAQRLVEVLIDSFDEVRRRDRAAQLPRSRTRAPPASPECVPRGLSALPAARPRVRRWPHVRLQLFMFQWMKINELPLSRKATIAASGWLRLRPTDAAMRQIGVLRDQSEQLHGARADASTADLTNLVVPASSVPVLADEGDASADSDDDPENTLVRKETIQGCDPRLFPCGTHRPPPLTPAAGASVHGPVGPGGAGCCKPGGSGSCGSRRK